MSKHSSQKERGFWGSMLKPYSVVAMMVFFVGTFFVAGDFNWVECYIYVATGVVGYGVMFGLLYNYDRGLFYERVSPSKSTQIGEDKKIMKILTLVMIPSAFIPMLDHRFGLSAEFPVYLKVMGEILAILGLVLNHYVFKYNSFASPLVKLQKERGQKVISSGPYAIVRHPMYLSLFMFFGGSSMLMGSVYGFLSAFVMTAMFAYRARIEEEMLIKEFGNDYIQYKKKVKYMVVPFVF